MLKQAGRQIIVEADRQAFQQALGRRSQRQAGRQADKQPWRLPFKTRKSHRRCFNIKITSDQSQIYLSKRFFFQKSQNSRYNGLIYRAAQRGPTFYWQSGFCRVFQRYFSQLGRAVQISCALLYTTNDSPCTITNSHWVYRESLTVQSEPLVAQSPFYIGEEI